MTETDLFGKEIESDSAVDFYPTPLPVIDIWAELERRGVSWI